MPHESTTHGFPRTYASSPHSQGDTSLRNVLIDYLSFASLGSGRSHASTFSGSMGMMQRLWPAAATSAGGSSVTTANGRRSGSPLPFQ